MSVARTGVADSYVWRPPAINVWIAMAFQNPLQAYALAEVRRRLEANGCIIMARPEATTPLGSAPHLAIGFADGLEEEVGPGAIYGRLPKPRGTVFTMTTVDVIPQQNLFDVARGQLLRKASHIGVVLEGDREGKQVRRALWASMAGNHCLLEGRQDDIFDSVALRVLAHASAEKVTVGGVDDAAGLTWEAWQRSPMHASIADAAHALGQAGILEDSVPLEQYGSSRQVRTVLRFLERAALGEGMRSRFDPDLRVMGVTASGGGKVSVSADPMAGHVVPVRRLTWDGYLLVTPEGCPITYSSPSVETHENGMVYLAGALMNAGLVDSFDGFLDYVRRHFQQQQTIDIVPAGLQPKVLAIDHFHRHPRPGSIKHPDKVELAYPDMGRFPQIDFPCGTRDAELSLLSALFQSKAFCQRGALDKVVIAVLPGHGSAAVYGHATPELIDVLINGMDMISVVGV